MTKLIQDRYAELCKELGHLRSNAKKVEARMAAIEDEIMALDNLSGLAQQEEARQRMEAKLENIKEQNRGSEQSK